MKKASFLTILFVTSFIRSVFPSDHKNSGVDSATTVTSLIINANVAVILVNDPQQPVNIVGDSFFMEQVSFKQKGNSLIITSARKKQDLRLSGVIYISAAGLKHIEINKAANIKSINILQLPVLSLSVNSECEVDIFINGKVELIGNDSYEIDYRSRDLSEPGLKNWKIKH